MSTLSYQDALLGSSDDPSTRMSKDPPMKATTEPAIGSKATSTPTKIDAFLAQLSRWELISLRQRVLSLEITGFKVLEDLPAELVCEIAEFLSPEDLLRAAQVSRKWRNKFGSEEVLEMACRRLFPGLLECNPKCADLLELFMGTYRLYKRKFAEEGRLVKWRPSRPGEDLDLVRQTVYSHGKLAYRAQDSIAVLDVLSGVVGEVHVPADRRLGPAAHMVVAISRDILVLVARGAALGPSRSAQGNLRYLQILSLGSLDDTPRWSSATLPSGLEQCYADGQRFIATCLNGQVFHWRWGGILEELPPSVDFVRDVPATHGRVGRTPSAIFHPQEETCFTVHAFAPLPNNKTAASEAVNPLSEDESERPAGCYLPELYVVKYIRDREGDWTAFSPAKRWPLELSEYMGNFYGVQSEQCTAPGRVPLGNLHLVCAKADNHGSFTVAIHFCTCSSDSRHYLATAICFNVLIERYFTVSWWGGHEGSSSVLASALHNPAVSSHDAPANSLWKSFRIWNRAIYAAHTRMNRLGGTIRTNMPYVQGLQWRPGVLSGIPPDFAEEINVFEEVYVDDALAIVCSSSGYTVLKRNTGSLEIV